MERQHDGCAEHVKIAALLGNACLLMLHNFKFKLQKSNLAVWAAPPGTFIAFYGIVEIFVLIANFKSRLAVISAILIDSGTPNRRSMFFLYCF